MALGLLTACSGGEEPDAAATTSAAAPASGAEETATGSAPTSAHAAESRTVTATEGNMFIELSADSFSAGSYTFEVVNEGSATHDFVVERDGSDVAGTETIAPGASTTLTVDLEPGEYVFYCSVGNHRAMGMEVTVTVT
jgi:uncharacterized cupredoxin-like copper-binding protein